MNSPPSTVRTWPVTKAAPGAARKATAAATSSGVPKRPRGVCLRRLSLKDLLEDFLDGKERMRSRLFTLAFDQFEDRPIAGRVVIDLQPFARQLAHDLLNRRRLM